MAIKPVETFDCVVFGATGDLTLRKLLPALYYRFRDGQIPAEARIIAAARSDFDDAAFRDRTLEALRKHVAKDDQDPATIDRFLNLVFYARGDAAREGGLAALAELLGSKPNRIRVFYLATSPGLYGPICQNLQAAGLVTANSRVGAREADRPRPGLGSRDQRRGGPRVQRGADLPHRPLPGQGNRAEPAGAALR